MIIGCSEHEQGTANPAHIIFQNIDYDDFTINPKLLEVYNWKPLSIGKTTKSKINKSGSISQSRQSKYRRPNQTERSGLITSRVGQGYYRQQIIEKWNGICAVSGTDVISILIASHIVPWSECTDNERLDVENGILLSPVYDALFDKYLISFDESGKIIISDAINPTNKEKLGLSDNIKINITKGMLTYLKRHNKKLFKTI